MEEAYEAALEQLGGLDAAKPKAVYELLQDEFPQLSVHVSGAALLLAFCSATEIGLVENYMRGKHTRKGAETRVSRLKQILCTTPLLHPGRQARLGGVCCPAAALPTVHSPRPLSPLATLWLAPVRPLDALCFAERQGASEPDGQGRGLWRGQHAAKQRAWAGPGRAGCSAW